MPRMLLSAAAKLYISSLLLFTLPALARPYIPDELIDALPSPISFLTGVEKGKDLTRAGLLGFLNMECGENSRALGCDIQTLIEKYDRIVQEVNTGNDVHADSPLKSWDLTSILSANFFLVPNSQHPNQGLDLITNLFMTRQKILQSLNHMYNILLRQNPSTDMYLQKAFWHAYVMSLTPVGAVNQVFSNIQCKLHDRACETAQSVWGSICSITVESNLDKFEDLARRFSTAQSDTSSEALKRLKIIENFESFVSKPIKSATSLKNRLVELEGNGLNNFQDSDYADLARATLIFGEFKDVMALRQNCRPFTIDVSPERAAIYRSHIKEIMAKQFLTIENALVTYGISNESVGQ